MFRAAPILLCSAVAALAAGCGSSGSSNTSSSSTQPPASSTPTSSTTTTTSAAVGALSAEAKSAATGDIPDTQVFLNYTNSGYSIVYPEGWTRKGSTNDVAFSDKNNIVHIVVTKAGTPTTGSVTAELNHLQQSTPSLKFTPPTKIELASGAAIRTTYTTLSAPNPVTGKSVLLVVDRYEFAKAGKRATVDLGTPKGVDNVDAYRRMINSFRWR